MDYRSIKDCDNYIVYENGDVKNIITNKILKMSNTNGRFYVKIRTNIIKKQNIGKSK